MPVNVLNKLIAHLAIAHKQCPCRSEALRLADSVKMNTKYPPMYNVRNIGQSVFQTTQFTVLQTSFHTSRASNCIFL